MAEEPRIDNESDCLAWFERIEQEVAETPMMVPPPEGVANYLARHCGPGVAAVLASRLVELGDQEPDWRTKAEILYLARVDDPVAADALLRFASATAHDDQRELAARSLVALGNPEVLARLEAELAKPELASPARLALEDAAERIRRGEKPEV